MLYEAVTDSFTSEGCYSWDILPGMNLALEQGLDVELEGENMVGSFYTPVLNTALT